MMLVSVSAPTDTVLTVTDQAVIPSAQSNKASATHSPCGPATRTHIEQMTSHCRVTCCMYIYVFFLYVYFSVDSSFWDHIQREFARLVLLKKHFVSQFVFMCFVPSFM